MSNYQEIINKWKERDIKTVQDLETVLSNFRILFAYHSGTIENDKITYHSTREIFENGNVINYTGDLRTLYEIQNQKDCYNFLKDKIIAKAPITKELILEIHEELTKGTYDETRWAKGERPGKFKINDYCVADGQGALPGDVESEIQELCEELLDVPDRGDNILKAAAYLHCRIENTHPFADGNGRVGRTLMNYFLMTHGLPPVVVRSETKNQYYKALSRFDKTGEVNCFVDYLKQSLVESWQIGKAPAPRLEQILE